MVQPKICPVLSAIISMLYVTRNCHQAFLCPLIFLKSSHLSFENIAFEALRGLLASLVPPPRAPASSLPGSIPAPVLPHRTALLSVRPSAFSVHPSRGVAVHATHVINTGCVHCTRICLTERLCEGPKWAL